jgi:hypothetical protein
MTVRQEKPDGPGPRTLHHAGGACAQARAACRKSDRDGAAEASYHAPYDHCTSKWLAQAGVKHVFVRLPDIGLRGNGHMMMLEKNNLEISAFLRKWEQENVK